MPETRLDVLQGRGCEPVGANADSSTSDRAQHHGSWIDFGVSRVRDQTLADILNQVVGNLSPAQYTRWYTPATVPLTQIVLGDGVIDTESVYCCICCTLWAHTY
jgi:hypothetical protein